MGKKQIVLVGMSGFAREILWQMSSIPGFTDEYEILGFVDRAPESRGIIVDSYPVIGDDDWLIDYKTGINAVICVGNSLLRKKIALNLSKNPNITFPSIIANDVNYSKSVKFGQGCIICLSNILTVNVSIGNFVISNLDCTIGHDSVLEDFVTLYPSVNVSGNVRIGSVTEIGTGANIIQGMDIGQGTIIGAGAVVSKNIPDNCTAVGIPAKPIKFRDAL